MATVHERVTVEEWTQDWTIAENNVASTQLPPVHRLIASVGSHDRVEKKVTRVLRCWTCVILAVWPTWPSASSCW